MTQKAGKIGVTSENIFPIIKKFLYSDHEIFLRELVSNAVDATQKLKTLAISGDFKGEADDIKVDIILNKENKTLTIRDNGIGMSGEEVEKYINQIAFSSAGDFLDKYKNIENGIIGHFGLGFYSSFMVSNKVEILTKSFRENEKAVKWECSGDPEYSLEETEKDTRGTDVILHIDDESIEFLEKNKIEELLNKYCKFLPTPIAFGKKTIWKDGKEQETDEDNIINNPKPLWKQKPVDLKDEDYKKFYNEIYPTNFEEPIFNIHLNVDHPFYLTGILYFPKIKSNLDINRNKIQLYSNQVFVTDSVEGIVPEFLTLLHGVLDSPDIPLNVSRSYLQSDANVKKISGHITKKVADKLLDIFKENREEFQNKWDDLKMFIEYGMISDEKFYERAEKFALFKNTDNEYFTFDEYKTKIETEQTDKDKNLIYLYATDIEEQFSYITTAKNKNYDVLLLDGQLDVHFINTLETKLKDSRFVRVDSDIIDNLIRKDDKIESVLSSNEQENLRWAFQAAVNDKMKYWISTESMSSEDAPVLITRDEFMRRMKDMSALGGGTGFYRELPDNYKVIINTNHQIIIDLSSKIEKKNQSKRAEIDIKIKDINAEKQLIEDKLKVIKNDDDKPIEDKNRLEELENQISNLETDKQNIYIDFGNKQKVISQLFDLALLSNNLLKGKSLSEFVKRSVDLLNPKK